MPKFRVTVRYLSRVEDPEAITVLKSLHTLGYNSIRNIRISKTFEFEFSGDKSEAEKNVKAIAGEILTNPVIQEFSIEEV
jgi:phosphoribosylformylglycinamidine synthase